MRSIVRAVLLPATTKPLAAATFAGEPRRRPPIESEPSEEPEPAREMTPV
jgi:hypothetical protein